MEYLLIVLFGLYILTTNIRCRHSEGWPIWSCTIEKNNPEVLIKFVSIENTDFGRNFIALGLTDLIEFTLQFCDCGTYQEKVRCSK